MGSKHSKQPETSAHANDNANDNAAHPPQRNVTSQSIRAYWLGIQPFDSVHALQKSLVQARMNNEISDCVLMLEHTPVITLGRHATREHLLVPEMFLKERGVTITTTDRGGDITYHGPGQLVAYPIVNLYPNRCSVRGYVQALAECMIGLAKHADVFAGQIDSRPGVWVDGDGTRAWPGQQYANHPAKLGSIGVRISRWVTMHGFAFNVCPDLTVFDWIVPCGIAACQVTSLAKLRSTPLVPSTLAPLAVRYLSEQLQTPLESYRDLSNESELAFELFLQNT